MPKLVSTLWSDKLCLELGKERITRFCEANGLKRPGIYLWAKERWQFSVCAYYRPESGINICVADCARLAGEARSRHWSWPGNSTDRTPYGVLAHELGHHADYHRSENKGAYYGDYSIACREEADEEPLTSYCPNDAEWFAEMFRLFVTNAALLREIRPNTYELLSQHWKPVSRSSWVDELGANVPERIVRAAINKGASYAAD